MAALLDQIEHALEAVRTAVIGIRHVPVRGEKPDLRVMLLRGHLLQRAQMPAVHREDQVELLEVPAPHLARALPAQIVAAVASMVLGALVGRLADVPVAKPGGFNP